MPLIFQIFVILTGAIRLKSNVKSENACQNKALFLDQPAVKGSIWPDWRRVAVTAGVPGPVARGNIVRANQGNVA